MKTTGDAGIVMSVNDWVAFNSTTPLFSSYWQKAESLSSPWTDSSWRYGFGWFFSEDSLGKFRAHSGRSEGFESYLRVNSNDSLFFLMLSNQTDPIVKELRNAIINEMKNI